MASGDLTASGSAVRADADVTSYISTLNLAAVTDTIHVVPVAGRDNLFLIFKVEREA